MKITICMLVRNERECLIKLLPEIISTAKMSKIDNLIAIDGNSTDGSVELLKEYGIPVLSQKIPGRGAAILEAIDCLDCDAILFFSPDGNENVEDFGKFRPLLEGGADLVIASRMMLGAHNEEDDQLFRFRKLANLAFNFMANMLFKQSGPFISDSINGYRAIKTNFAKKLNLSASDYTIEYQMTIRTLKAQGKISEFPTIENARIAGNTGAPSIPTGLRFLRRLFTECISK